MAKKKGTQANEELTKTLNKSEEFVTKYKWPIIATIVAIIAIIGASIGWNHYSNSRNETASKALAYGEQWFLLEDYEKALNGDSIGNPGFKSVINQYSGTKAANLANLYAGICLTKLEKWDEAAKYLENYKPGDDLEISPAATMALGDCYVYMKQYDKAVETFKQAAKIADNASKDGINNAISPVALNKAAIVLMQQLKKNDEALEIFKTIKEKYRNASIDVDKYIEYLENLSK